VFNKLYYFGGLIEDEHNKHILIYDIATDNWTGIVPLNPINYIATIDPIVLVINK
jgi:hypothetical protein